MNLRGLSLCYAKCHQMDVLRERLLSSVRVCMGGLVGSAQAAVLSGLMRGSDDRGTDAPSQLLAIEPSEHEAALMLGDLQALLGSERVVYLPCLDESNSESRVWRAEVVARLAAAERGLVVVTHAAAVQQPVESPDTAKTEMLRLEKGQALRMRELKSRLLEMGLERVDYVYSPGEWAVRGSIIDVFPFNSLQPFRVDFLGNEIDTIRQFDVESQLSTGLTEAVNLMGARADSQPIQNSEFLIQSEEMVPITRLLGERAVVYYDNALLLRSLPELKGKHAVLIGREGNRQKAHVVFSTRAEARLLSTEEGNKRIRGRNTKSEDSSFIIHHSSEASMADEALSRGFVDTLLSIGAFSRPAVKGAATERALLHRLGNTSLRNTTLKGEAARWLRAMREFDEGDYVVHADHGVGRFVGLVEVDHWGGQPQQMMKLMYKDQSVVYVSVHAIGKVSKYKSATDEPPRLSALGSGVWQRLKERTKKRVKDIARDLILLYSRRLTEKGFAFSPDGELAHTLERSFPYVVTPDQERAINDVRGDMERDIPMDRLVCGDVGFGKTEVAIRAALKAATDGKQVAVLVPTTVLAYQHFQTFSERLRDMPVTLAYLSRACTPKQTTEIQEGLRDGRIDIVIGTHKLLSPKIEYHDLGLLIIDEEQKFGVATKEKLRQLRSNIDTLTLTATPIPRTLQFSLMGARDLSVISTPPLNRLPIQTEVCEMSDEVIAEAIRNELSRDGQVFFVCNRIARLPMLAERIRSLVPEARITIGHGAMAPTELEKVVMQFIAHETDVLLSTTIVENGVDIPNANTIIIADAHNYGLSDLHQIRGRVGRTDRRAYCYLCAPPLDTLPQNARRRLEALVGFSQLGSGLQIAMQDLDIRGAGNVLGAEQSGFIADLGFDTYMKVLREAVGELKSEAREPVRSEDLLFTIQHSSEASEAWAADCSFDSDLPLFLPESYIPGNSERIAIYRQLERMTDERGLNDLRHRLTDRFGPLPREVEDLLLVVPLRHTALENGIERITLKEGRLQLCFVPNDSRGFYQSETFTRWLRFINLNPRRCRLENRNNSALLTIEGVTTVADAQQIINNA